jgi:hypothetical protein
MAIKFVPIDKESCMFQVNRDGDDDQSHSDILHCIQSALKGSMLNIEIDVTEKPEVLETILPEVRSLQRVMQNHSKSLTIKGLSEILPPETLALLSQLNVKTQFKGEKIATRQSPVVVSTAERLDELRLHLAAKIKVLRELKNEKSFYQERYKCLRDGVLDTVASDKQSHVSKLEKEVLSLSEMKKSSESQLELAEKKFSSLEVEVTDVSKKILEEQKKKRVPLEKKLADLQKKMIQMTQDFERRAQARAKQREALLAKKSEKSE